MRRKIFSWGTWPVVAAVFLVAVVMTSVISAAGQDFKVKQMTAVPSQPEFVPGEILVKFKPAVPDEAINRMNRAHGTSVIYTSPYVGFKRLRIPPTKTIEEMVEIYSKNPNVEYAEPNAICYAFMVPNDPLYGYQWHFDNAVYGGINMEAAWDVETGDVEEGEDPVIVGVLDTGVAYEDYEEYQKAPDLALTTFVSGYDFINDDEHPNDDEGHGTHVTGTIAQTTNNGVGVAGIAFNCSIMPVKVLNSQGSGTAAILADGLRFAADNGADVINMSLGWRAGYDPGETVKSAIEYAYEAGVTLVAASGNDGSRRKISYPAAYDDYVIAVGATRYDERVPRYSNKGASLDLTAPGGDVTVDQNGDGYGDGVLQQTFGNSPSDFGYWFYQGTSMASPHVAGVAALVIANGVTGPDNVRNALESTAEDHGDDGWDSQYGWGIVDAAAALDGAPPPILEITTTSLPDGVVGEAYSTTLEAAGGTTPYTWSISGDLPAGLTLSSSEGVISGIPIAEGVSTFIAKVTDSSDPIQEDTQVLSIAVTEAPTYPTMHVASIDMSTSVRGVNTTASATVKIVYANDNPLEGATVYGSWSGLTGDTDSGITDANGQVTLTSDRVKNARGTFTFTVDDVSKEGWEWTDEPGEKSGFITVGASKTVGKALTGNSLGSASPNPANPRTEIRYSVGQSGQVTLKVYSTLGQLVRTLVDEVKASGIYTIRWDGRDDRGVEVSSGIYLYRIAAGEYSQTKRMILLR